MNQYETVFILTPVLSDVQMKAAVEKFKGILQAEGAEIINEENWQSRSSVLQQDHQTPLPRPCLGKCGTGRRHNRR